MNVTRGPGESDKITVGLAQDAPIWLDRDATLERVVERVDEAGAAGCQLVVFGEAFVPGYPFWLGHTGGAIFDSPTQKKLFSHYLDQAVDIERGDLRTVCDAATRTDCAVVLGVVERPTDRGGHSLYCTMVTVLPGQGVVNAHRKLQPTYEERLVWSPGDGHGLTVQKLGPFTMGGLNCWENWMPLPRAALYGQGEDLHVAIWPGSVHNTVDLTRVMAREGRSYVISVSALFNTHNLPADVPELDEMRNLSETWLANGGSCIAAPDGTWLVEPQAERPGLIVAEIDHAKVRQERQNFDPSGHYSRPDITRLIVDRTRQRTVTFKDTGRE